MTDYSASAVSLNALGDQEVEGLDIHQAGYKTDDMLGVLGAISVLSVAACYVINQKYQATKKDHFKSETTELSFI